MTKGFEWSSGNEARVHIAYEIPGTLEKDKKTSDQTHTGH